MSKAYQHIKKNVCFVVETVETVEYAQYRASKRRQMPHTSSQFEKCGGYHGTCEFYS